MSTDTVSVTHPRHHRRRLFNGTTRNYQGIVAACHGARGCSTPILQFVRTRRRFLLSTYSAHYSILLLSSRNFFLPFNYFFYIFIHFSTLAPARTVDFRCEKLNLKSPRRTWSAQIEIFFFRTQKPMLMAMATVVVSAEEQERQRASRSRRTSSCNSSSWQVPRTQIQAHTRARAYTVGPRIKSWWHQSFTTSDGDTTRTTHGPVPECATGLKVN